MNQLRSIQNSQSSIVVGMEVRKLDQNSIVRYGVVVLFGCFIPALKMIFYYLRRRTRRDAFRFRADRMRRIGCSKEGKAERCLIEANVSLMCSVE